MLIQTWPLTRIKPYEGNPRKITDPAVDAVVDSIKEFGFRQPIVVDELGVIIVGHVRYWAAKRIGLENVPVHVISDLSPEKVRAYRIADNKTGELTDWDDDLLLKQISELKNADYDLSSLGFDDKELAAILNSSVNEGNCDPDEAPPLPEEPITVAGEIWQLGAHRLMCGDSGDGAHVDRLLNGATIHLAHTDPPYNVNVAPRAEVKEGRAKDRFIENDNLSDRDYQSKLRRWFENIARVLAPGRTFYIWGGFRNCESYPRPLRLSGLHFSQAIIWVKHHPVVGRLDFMTDHEWCFYGWKKGESHQFLGANNERDVWELKKVPQSEMVHLTQKPVEIAERAITLSTVQDENVLDLFGGSGTTLIAAERLGRTAYLMEMDPLYCDVIVQRWEKFTGKKAERIHNGQHSPDAIKADSRAARKPSNKGGRRNGHDKKD